ncbi:carboxylesterase [Beggiatoa alba]|nr:carboxylesterase [Beggiatoa alba]
MEKLKTLEINASNPLYSIIWLHGLGADGHDFEPIVSELRFSNKHKTRFILPHAPSIAVSINNGMLMPAWYDIIAPHIDVQQDEKGIRQSAKQIEQLIETEISRGIKSQHILLAGFSQGGAIALHSGLRYPKPLMGILALSTYLPLEPYIADESDMANEHIPIFYAHGTLDSVIPISLAEKSKHRLNTLGYKIDWHNYPMEHSVIPDEISDISAWLDKILTD